jgi:hypothetical protein
VPAPTIAAGYTMGRAQGNPAAGGNDPRDPISPT